MPLATNCWQTPAQRCARQGPFPISSPRCLTASGPGERPSLIHASSVRQCLSRLGQESRKMSSRTSTIYSVARVFAPSAPKAQRLLERRRI